MTDKILAEKAMVPDSKERYAEQYGFHEEERYVFKGRKGLSHDVVREMSRMKNEPEWMTDFRLKALDIFLKKPMPTWGADLSGIDFDDDMSDDAPATSPWGERPDEPEQDTDEPDDDVID